VDAEEREEHKRLRDEIGRSPGMIIRNEIRGVRQGVHLFKRNKDELMRALDAFEHPKNLLRLLDISNYDQLHASMDEVGRLLHNFLAAATSLIDCVHTHRKHLYKDKDFDEEISAKVAEHFTNSDRQLVKDLRSYVLHRRPVPVQAIQLTWSGHRGPPSPDAQSTLGTRYALSVSELLARHRWTAPARAQLKSCGDQFVIRDFVERYSARVGSFYEWLWDRQQDMHARDLEATNELIRRRKALEDS